MSIQIPSLTDKQLRVYEVVHKVRMAWVALIVVLGAFIVVLIALLFAAFSQTVGPWIKGAFATIDGLLGVCLHQVIRHLFPTTGVKHSSSAAKA
jgi:Flp pilus assembly pilin Flp